MAEWVDTTQEWTDLLAPEWEGDLSVPIGSAVALTATVPEHTIRVDCYLSLAMELLTLVGVTAAATVRADTNVAVASALAPTVTPQGVAFTIASAAILGSAISAELVVQAHIGANATIIYPQRAQIVSNQKTPALTIESEIQIGAAMASTITALEPSHVGVIEIVTIDETLSLTTSLLATDLTIDPVVVAPDVFNLACSLLEALPYASSALSAGDAIVVSLSLKEATIVVECAVSAPALPLGLDLQSITIRNDVLISEPITLAATLKTPGLTFHRIVEIGAAVALALDVADVGLTVECVAVTDVAPLAMAVSEHVAEYDYHVACESICGALMAVFQEPPSYYITSNVAIAAVELVSSVHEVSYSYDYTTDYLTDGLALLCAQMAPVVEMDFYYSVSGLIGALECSFFEPNSIDIASQINAATMILTIGIEEHIARLDYTYDAVSAICALGLVLLDPEYYGPMKPEALLLDSYITRELVIESDTDIRMSAYG